MDHDLEVKTYSPAKSLGHARRRAAVMLLVATLVSALVGAVLFAAVLKGEWMTALFRASAEFMFRQPVWAIIAATSPLAAALLVGYGYMQRAIRKRAVEKQEALRQAAAPTDVSI
ncbi:MAG: hypothetical protein ACOZIN_18610 [Myxococcota bacterium]